MKGKPPEPVPASPVVYVNPSYLEDGLEVYIDCRFAGIKDKKPGTGLRCYIAKAHGDHGQVVNDQYGFSKLMSRWDMYIPRNT